MAEDKELTIADDLVVTKYKMAGEMANSKLSISVDLSLSLEPTKPTF